ncbi:MAG TPA: polysaccharide biosynthesis tyrosine autokinase [Thermoanaerobaculia bacterium]|nr:polysaccharide biosynthesis tyrosine autokinase [Thermoanaerobaculia bacterium]
MSSPFNPFEEASAAPAQESEFNLGEYLGMVRRHWRLVAALCATCIAASVIHYLITPKEYRASAMLQIERRSLTPLVGNNQNPWLDNYLNLEFYPTQYKLLESRGLAERVVRHLDLMSDPSRQPAAASRLRKAPGAAPSAADDEAVLGALADGLRGGLSIEPLGNTQLVSVSYRSGDPEFAARAANAFAEEFIDLGIENRYTTVGKASSFLGAQVGTLKQEIQDRETQLQAFSRHSGIVAVDPESNVLLQRLETLGNDFMEAKKQRFAKEAAYQEVLSAPKETVADSLSAGLVSELRAEQIRAERDYDGRLKTFKPEWPAMQELKAKVDKGRQNLNAVIDEMVAKARSSAYAEYQTALRQEQALAGELERVKGQAIDQNSAAVEFTNLKLEVESRREMLDQLMQKQSETEVTARLQDTRDSNVRIIDQALVPSGPFRPSLRQDLTYGLFIGLLFGIGCAFLIEFLDRSLKTPEQVERRLGLATLAVIPDFADGGKKYGAGYGYGYGDGPTAEKDEAPRARPVAGAPVAWLEKKRGGGEPAQIELVPHDRPRTPISEAYRALRTALLLASAEELKVVAVTSAGASEGKTATAANLAVVLAQLGRQVLIVDSDLRKPRLHQIFKTSNRLGLVNHLTGGADPESVFLRTEVPNLWLTPSGPIPPNPSELLASDRMREWLRLARSRFDFVVVDTPPVLPVTDATIAGAWADGVVLTLRAGKVTREDARACLERLRQAEVKVLGAVLNRHRSAQGQSGKRYRYYESYGTYESEPQAGSAA